MPECADWCVDGDRHGRENFRADQYCVGDYRSVVLSLGERAPAAHAETDYNDPHVAVFARRDHHMLPVVDLHMYRDHHSEYMCLDADIKLTPGEAVELARNLIAVVEQIAGGA